MTKSLDRSTKVRAEVYKVLKGCETIRFLELNILDRIQLMLNGLNDIETEVKELCREYIISSLCIADGSEQEDDSQLKPIMSTLRALDFR